MIKPNDLLLSLAMFTVAVAARGEATVDMPEVPTGVAAGMAADSSPDMESVRDELGAQWEADARAAGLDPDKVEAKSEPESGGAK